MTRSPLVQTTDGMLRALLGSVLVVAISGYPSAVRSDTTITPLPQSSFPDYRPVGVLEGQLTITGSDTMAPLLNQLALEFSRVYGYPSVRVFIESTGSTQAIREFLMGYSQQRRGDKSREGHEAGGIADILASSRRLTEKERAHFRSRYGYDVTEIPIAEDAVAIYVHRDNPLQQLTLDQVTGIFRKAGTSNAAGDITVWGQLGLEGAWKNKPIHLYGRDKQSGTREFFVDTVLHGGEFKADIHEAPGSASEMLAISGDPLAIGYAGIGFRGSLVKALALAEGHDKPAVAPTAETVADRTYPLRRTLYLYVNHDPEKGPMPPLLREFLRYANSADGQRLIAKAQFYSISQEQLVKNISLIRGQ